jgi:hypothetical protein
LDDTAAMIEGLTQKMDERLAALTYRVRLNSQGKQE